MKKLSHTLSLQQVTTHKNWRELENHSNKILKNYLSVLQFSLQQIFLTKCNLY